MGRTKKNADGIDIDYGEDITQDGIEAKTESPDDKIEIIKCGVTRIRARADVPAYLAQGWKVK